MVREPITGPRASWRLTLAALGLTGYYFFEAEASRFEKQMSSLRRGQAMESSVIEVYLQQV